MKNVARITMVSAALMAVPAMASEVGVMVDKQFGKAQTVIAGSFAGAPAGKIDSVGPTGFGIRGAYTLLNLKVAELGLTASYHSKAEGDVVIEGTKYGKLGSEYMAIGAQVDWKFLVNLHLGLDLRREKFTTSEFVAAVNNGTTTSTRPWVRAGIGFSVPTPVVSPFFRLEVAMTTAKEDKTDNQENLRKALAPEYQVGLYGGIRF
ncbi:MAG: hypothetical protein IPN59_15735 [Holophaga sp.]|nr:hypothetical protein [Holophaga sp.]